MVIKIPNNNVAERKYIIDIIFSESLGLDYKIEMHNSNDYELFDNELKLVIKDYFFSNFINNSYLNKRNIPKSIELLKNNKFLINKDLPIIFGKPIIESLDNNITCHIDIFASAFFMLSRWEEYVIKEKDKNGRFPDELSLAFRSGFHKRAIVNEYVELLWNLLKEIGIKQNRKQRNYNLFLTHDIDFFRRYDTPKKLIKAIGGDIIKRKSPKLAKETISIYNKINLGTERDPYDTFDLLMNISDSNGIKSHFYFIPEIIGEADAQYNITDKELVSTIENIIERDHIVGAHFGFDTFNNNNLLEKEKQRLCKNVENLKESRQHYLRFAVPTTWQILEQNNIKIDSSLGYSSFVGFRCGTCYEFSVFDILERKKLNLKEYPLIVMDTALATESDRNKDVFLQEIDELYKTVKKFSGTFVFLWHQNNTALAEWEFISFQYKQIINMLKS